MNRSTRILLLILAASLVLASCAPGPNSLRGVSDESGKIAGFWKGLWHGFIAPFTFIVSLFSKSLNVYEAHNNGGWYNFGYILGLSVIFGGGSGGACGARRRKHRND